MDKEIGVDEGETEFSISRALELSPVGAELKIDLKNHMEARSRKLSLVVPHQAQPSPTNPRSHHVDESPRRRSSTQHSGREGGRAEDTAAIHDRIDQLHR